MANKRDPNRVIDRFQTELEQIRSDSREIDEILLREGKKIEFRRRMYADFFLRASIEVERFLSDWFMAAINKEPDTARSQLEQQVRKSAKDLGIEDHLLSPNFVSKTHVNMKAIENFLDSDGHNYTFYDVDDFQTKASKWLDPIYVHKIDEWNSFKYSPIFLTKLLRNALAHDSVGGYKKAKEELSKKYVHKDIRKIPSEGFNRKSIQTYLYEGDPPRFETILSLLSERAEDLRR